MSNHSCQAVADLKASGSDIAYDLSYDYKVGANEMTLWNLMITLCTVMPLAGALATVRDIQKGWVGYSLAIIIGALVGILCAWAMRATGTYFAARSGAMSDTKERYFRILYVAAAAWIILALFLGSWLTAAFMRYI